MKKPRAKSGNVLPDMRNFTTKLRRHLYVVGNQSDARFYLGSDAHPFDEVAHFSNPSGRLSECDLESDRPGRSFSSAGGRSIHHALGKEDVKRNKHARAYAKLIAKEIDRLHLAETITGITLVSEPHFLGLMRSALPPALKKLVDEEIPLELMYLPDRELYRRIHSYLPKRRAS